MVLALAADVVGQGLGHLGKWVAAGGVEDLGGAAEYDVSQRGTCLGGRGFNLLCVEVEGQSEVVEDALGEGGVEEDLALLDVAEQDQAVWVDAALGRGVQHGTGLEDELVGAEVSALNERKLVLVREVEWASSVLHQAEVEALHALGGWVRAVVAGREKLGTAEAQLNIVCAGSENGLVATKSVNELFMIVEKYVSL